MTIFFVKTRLLLALSIALLLTGCGGPSAQEKAQDRAARNHAIQQGREQLFIADLQDNFVALGPVFSPRTKSEKQNLIKAGWGNCNQMASGIDPKDIAAKGAQLGVMYAQVGNFLTIAARDLCPDQQAKTEFAFAN